MKPLQIVISILLFAFTLIGQRTVQANILELLRYVDLDEVFEKIQDFDTMLENVGVTTDD